MIQYILIGILTFSSLGLFASSRIVSCNQFELYQELLKSRIQKFHILGSTNQVKTLNAIFNGDSEPTERYMGELYFLFQYYLRQLAGDEHAQIFQSPTAPYIKLISFETPTTSYELAKVSKLVSSAIELAVKTLAQYYFDRDQEASFLIKSIEGPQSEFASRGFVFPEGRSFLIPFDNEFRLGAKITGYHRTPERFIELQRKSFAIGIGGTEIDAHFAVKDALANPSKYQGVATYNIYTLFEHIRKIIDLNSSIEWATKNQSIAFLSNLFTEVRAHSEVYGVDGLGANLLKTLQKSGAEDAFLFEELLRLREYMAALNILEFVPPSELNSAGEARDLFGALANPTGLLFIDFLGLGAKNLAEVHFTTNKLADHFEQLEIELQKTFPNGEISNPEALAKADQIYAQISLLRQNIVLPTINYVREQIRALEEQMQEFGLKKNLDYVLWQSGDDVFIVLRSDQSTRTLVKKIMAKESLRKSIRIGYWDYDLPEHVTLGDARFAVGSAAEPIKVAERLFGDNVKIIARMRSDKGRHVVEMYMLNEQGDLLPVDAKDLEKLQDFLPSWSFFNGTK